MISLEQDIIDNLTEFEIAQPHIFEPFESYRDKNVVLAFSGGYHSLFLLHLMLHLKIVFTLAYVRQRDYNDDRQFEHIKSIAYRYNLPLEVHKKFRHGVRSYPAATAHLLQGMGYTNVVMGSTIDSSYAFHDLLELSDRLKALSLPIGRIPTWWLERAYNGSYGYSVTSFDCTQPTTRRQTKTDPSCRRCGKCQEQVKLFGETSYMRRHNTSHQNVVLPIKKIPTNYFSIPGG